MTVEAVAVHDILDVGEFVRAHVRRKLRRLRDREEFEEMVAEGLVIMFELAGRYDPAKDKPKRKAGHVCRNRRCCVPSFAGYASFQLPLKLLDAWHANHPEHLLRTQPDGTRKYVYLKEACSLDGGVKLERDIDNIFTLQRNTLERNGTRFPGMFTPVPEINPEAIS